MLRLTLGNLRGTFVLFVTILASAMAFLDGSVVTIASPTIQIRLQATIGNIQWVLNGYLLMLASFILISGVLGDKLGRKKIFLGGIGVFVVSSVLCGLSSSIVQLIIFRILQGLGAALMVPGSLSILHVSFDEKVQGKVIGLWSGLAGGVTALGPFVGGFLVQTFGWQSIFYINVPLGIMAFLLTVVCIEESRDPNAAPIDIIGALLLFVSLLGFAYGLIQGPQVGWNNLPIWGSLSGGLMAAVAFIFSEKRSMHPLIPFTIFRSPLVTGANLVTLFLYFALNGLLFFLSLNLQQMQHFSPIYAGAGLLPSILLITFFSGYGGSLADKIGPRKPMILGPLLVGIGMTLLAFTGLHANYFISFLPPLVLFGVGMSLVIAPLTKSALAVSPVHSGAASGVNNALARIAGLLAIALLGIVVLGIFSYVLPRNLSSAGVSSSQQHAFIIQENKLGAMRIPVTISADQRAVVQEAIDRSFLRGFQIAMAICGLLAFISSWIAYKIIPKGSTMKLA